MPLERPPPASHIVDRPLLQEVTMRHQRHRVHNPRAPAQGDGSCWVTPEGYIPCTYENHRYILTDEGLQGYWDAHQHGWIRVGVHHDSFTGKAEPEISMYRSYARLDSLRYLQRILTPLLGLGSYPRLANNENTTYAYLRDAAKIREYVEKAVRDRQLPVTVQDPGQSEMVAV